MGAEAPFRATKIAGDAPDAHTVGVTESRTKHVVLYDGECPLCTFQMRLITWLDWFHVVSLIPINHPAAAGLAPHLTQEQLLEAVHCVTPAGRVYRGARCFRFLGLRIPLLLPLGLVLWIPGVIWIAEKVYAWVSRHRHLLSRLFGCKEACRIMPARKRANESSLVHDPADSFRS